MIYSEAQTVAQLAEVPWPVCAHHCTLFHERGFSHCEQVCGHKFDRIHTQQGDAYVESESHPARTND